MKIKHLFLFTISMLYFLPVSIGCSCIQNSFCQISNNAAIVFKGTVIDNIEYSLSNHAIYIEVEKIYKGNATITDTIKLYGAIAGTSCDFDLISRYPIGTKMLTTIGFSGTPTNPDAATENYWESTTSQCSFINLKIEGESVIGPIAPGVSSYPLVDFENDFSDCSVLNKDLIDIQCASNNLFIYPNPVLNKRINLISNFFGNSLEQINIYSLDGKLVQVINEIPDSTPKSFNIEGLAEGVHILETINARGEACYRKILVF